MSKQVKLSRSITDLSNLSSRANEIESIIDKIQDLSISHFLDKEFSEKLEAFEEVLNEELESLQAKARTIFKAVS